MVSEFHCTWRTNNTICNTDSDKSLSRSPVFGVAVAFDFLLVSLANKTHEHFHVELNRITSGGFTGFGCVKYIVLTPVCEEN